MATAKQTIDIEIRFLMVLHFQATYAHWHIIGQRWRNYDVDEIGDEEKEGGILTLKLDQLE